MVIANDHWDCLFVSNRGVQCVARKRSISFKFVLQLTQVNEKLSEYAQVQAGGPNATVLHTLQRHWDILQDYSHEFRKIRTNVCAIREREELLDVVHRDRFVAVYLGFAGIVAGSCALKILCILFALVFSGKLQFPFSYSVLCSSAS